MWSSLVGFFCQTRILEYTKFEMRKKALEAFRDLGEDEELGPADWLTVERYIKSLGNVEGEQVHRHDTSEMGGNHVEMNLKCIRVRLLNGTILSLCSVVLRWKNPLPLVSFW